MNDTTTMTPREYCASLRSLPFGAHTLRHGVPDWRKIGRGLIAVTDGSERQRVKPGLIFAVELDGAGKPQIYNYRVAPDGVDECIAELFSYTWKTTKRCAAEGKIVRIRPVAYSEMCRLVRKVYGGGTWCPPENWFLAEYGVKMEKEKEED